MKTIVASYNPDLGRDFDRELLRRRDLRLVTARDTAELLARLREGAALCFVDRMLPDGDAVAALDAIRAERQLAGLPVVLVAGAGAPLGERAALLRTGFDDVIALPAPPGALSLIVGRLLGVPLREEERFAVRVHVFHEREREAVPAGEQYIGTTVDLSERGMLLKARRAAAPGMAIAMRFALPGAAAELHLRGRVVRVDEVGFAPQKGVALAFEEVSPAERAALHEYLRVLVNGRPFRWRVEEHDRRRVVWLSGALRGGVDLGPLARLMGTPSAAERAVWIAMRDLRHISSDGVQSWIDFVRALPHGLRLSLVEVPVAFVQQANLAASLLERQEVVSFYAPYSCPRCGLEEERLLELARDFEGGARVAPALTCSACAGPLVFDELVEQYFVFLGAFLGTSWGR